MQLTKIFENKIETLWEKTLRHPMLEEMALGTLEKKKFCYYMIQDYFYVLRYIDIFSIILTKAKTIEEKEFICDNIYDLIKETRRVHIPKMKKMGITDLEIKKQRIALEIFTYTNYMKEIVDKYDYLTSLVAILNCSWNYAYIAKKMLEKYPVKINNSPYKEWFLSYGSEEYLKTNSLLCRKINQLSKNYSEKEKEKLSEIFYNCGLYEYRFWDIFYNY